MKVIRVDELNCLTEDIVNRAQNIDIIQCKECKYCIKSYAYENTYYCYWDWDRATVTKLDGFCHRGERKSDS